MQQWRIQINVPPILEENGKLMYAFEENIRSYNQEQSPTVQVVHNQEIATASLSKVPSTLPLKYITGKPVCVYNNDPWYENNYRN